MRVIGRHINAPLLTEFWKYYYNTLTVIMIQDTASCVHVRGLIEGRQRAPSVMSACSVDQQRGSGPLQVQTTERWEGREAFVAQQLTGGGFPAQTKLQPAVGTRVLSVSPANPVHCPLHVLPPLRPGRKSKSLPKEETTPASLRSALKDTGHLKVKFQESADTFIDIFLFQISSSSDNVSLYAWFWIHHILSYWTTFYMYCRL